MKLKSKRTPKTKEKKKVSKSKSKEKLETHNDENITEETEETNLKENEEPGNQYIHDENSKWIQPKKKQNLLSDSDDDNDDDDDDDEEEDENDDSERSPDDKNISHDEYDEDENASVSTTDSSLLSIERQSKLLDNQIAKEKAEGEAEYQHIIKTQTSIYQLPGPEEIQSETDGTRVISPTDLRDRIQSILEVLLSFKDRKQPERSRTDYIDRLSSDMSELFGYLPELIDYFLSMLGPHETMEFLEASDASRPVVLRTNTLKTRRKDLAQALIKRGVNLDPLSDWSKVGLKIYESPVPLGATPEYLAGYYMLQSAASMCPVLALSPNVHQRVLDMSAAPGGKTSYIAQLMKNTGMILANDLKPERQKATIGNMHRLGVKNTIVSCQDGRKLGQLYPNSFHRVLLDAPCSGLGVISRDPSVKVQRTMADILRTSHLQKELLLSAVDALNVKKDGGIMVYSTCSVSIAENEEVVDYLLRKRYVKIVDTGLDFGKPGFTRYQQKRFHSSLSLTRRFYPHVHNMDGFYVCKIQKIRHGELRTKEEQILEEEGEETKSVDANKVHNEISSDDHGNDDVNVMKKIDNKKESKDLFHKGKLNSVKKSKGGKKKRKRTEKELEHLELALNEKKKIVSTPPSLQLNANKKKKKNMTNAKISKPRRRKSLMKN